MSDRKNAKQQESGKKGAEFICKVRYKNPLPPIPFGPKFLAHPVDESKYTDYIGLELEKRALFPLMTDFHMGMMLDLVDLDDFRISDRDENLDELDRALLNPPQKRPTKDEEKDSVGQRFRPVVPWLRRTEYISTETKTVNKKNETSSLHKKRMENLPEQANSRETQIRAIERSFDAAREWEIMGFQKQHPTKPGVHPVEIFPIFPDFQLWKSKYAHCIFDDNPTPRSALGSALQAVCEDEEDVDQEVLEKSVMKGFDVENNGQPHMYFYVPDASTVASSKRTRGEELERRYESFRHYSYHVVPHKPMEKVFISVHPEAGAFYNPINAKFTLRKRRKMKSTSESPSAAVVPTNLEVTMRDFSEEENKAQERTLELSLGIVL